MSDELLPRESRCHPLCGVCASHPEWSAEDVAAHKAHREALERRLLDLLDEQATQGGQKDG